MFAQLGITFTYILIIIMTLTFHGAAQTVTGSKHLLTLDDGTNILFDCGLFQGMGDETLALNTHFGFDAKSINMVLLSHAHIDHTGLLPKLVKEGFEGKIYCTPATAELAAALLLDSAHIQEADIKFVNKKKKAKGEAPIEPLYTQADAEKTATLFSAINYNEPFKINENLSVVYNEAGHILGSASIHVTVQENNSTKQITFSGDVGRYNDAILNAPQAFTQADYIILESTYGDSLHDGFTSAEDVLLQNIVHTCIEKKGTLIIPAFSVGRTQELLYMLNKLSANKLMPPVPVYVDSPLSVKVTAITQKYAAILNKNIQEVLGYDPDAFDFDQLHFVISKQESMALNSNTTPCIIISASGMAEAGRVKHHIANKISDAKNTILFSGYCSPHGLGGQLKAGNKTVRIFTVNYEVQAEVQSMRSMSAHGDYNDLLHFLSGQNTEKIKQLFLVHGEYEVQQNFKNTLILKGFKNVYIPQMHEKIIL
jgi:metallo-beta-lactamase family protein